MKIFSVIALLVYWSVIILAPVIAKEQGKFSNNIKMEIIFIIII